MKRLVPVLVASVVICLTSRSKAEPSPGAADATNQIQFFSVAGDGVNSPGRFTLQEGITVTNAIKMSGGFVQFSRHRVEVTRKGQMQPFIVDLSPIESGLSNDVKIQAGDYIYVKGPRIIHQKWHDSLQQSRGSGTNQSAIRRYQDEPHNWFDYHARGF